MRKHLIIAVSLLTMYSCSPGGGTTTPTTPTPPTTSGTGSTFNVSFNGYTYNFVSNASQKIIISGSTNSNLSGYLYGYQANGELAKFAVSVGAITPELTFTATGLKITPDATGVYRTGSTDNVFYGSTRILHHAEGNKEYWTDFSGVDTNGVINVTVSNATECKGTFTTIATYNGTHYPVTGDFHYKK